MTCPICGRVLPTSSPAETSFVPFCSERCQLVDFHRWWKGQYAIVDDLDPTQLPVNGDGAQEVGFEE